jgi:hypothetical protein
MTERERAPKLKKAYDELRLYLEAQPFLSCTGIEDGVLA